MIETVTLTALLGKNEREKIYNSIDTSSWKHVSPNCISAKLTNGREIESVALITPDEHTDNNKSYQYTLLSITFTFTDYVEQYNQYIQRLVKNIFPNMRKLDFKVHYIRYHFVIDDKNTKQYFELLQSGFEMHKREMVRNIFKNNIIWQNKDTKIQVSLKNDLHIRISIDKGRIHSLIKKLEFKGRTAKELLSAKNVKKLESYVINDYLKAICGVGDYYILSKATSIIEKSEYIPTKKEHLVQFITEISEYNDIERFLNAVEQGMITATQKRKTAMDYIRCLNEIGVNPLTLKNNSNMNMIPNILTLIK